MLPKDIFHKHTYIGLDLDETLAESALDMFKKLQEQGQLHDIKNFEEIDNFEWHTFPSCTWTKEEMHDFYRKHLLTDVLPIPNSILGVAELFKREKYLSVITARNEHDHRSDTIHWLGLYFPEIHPSQIYFANHSSHDVKNKSDICKAIGVTLMIDDALHNALDLVENGIECILIDKPWNRLPEANHPSIYRISHWQEIIDIL